MNKDSNVPNPALMIELKNPYTKLVDLNINLYESKVNAFGLGNKWKPGAYAYLVVLRDIVS